MLHSHFNNQETIPSIYEANYHFFMIVPYFFLYSVNNFLKFVKGQLRINLPGHVMINFLYMKMDSNGWY